MQKYSVAMCAAVAEGRQDWMAVQRWVERFICGTSVGQGVVGMRHHPDGGMVTQQQFDAGDKVAHVCPFVRDALDADLFYIESSDETDLNKIRKHITARLAWFKSAEPAFDPLTAGRGAEMPVALKTALIFFPKYEPPVVGANIAVDRTFQFVIMTCIRQGLMLGQFYRGCAEPAVHNPAWKKVLTAPYLAFALRYMQPHDRLFVKEGTPGWPIYLKLFGEAHAPH